MENFLHTMFGAAIISLATAFTLRAQLHTPFHSHNAFKRCDESHEKIYGRQCSMKADCLRIIVKYCRSLRLIQRCPRNFQASRNMLQRGRSCHVMSKVEDFEDAAAAFYSLREMRRPAWKPREHWQPESVHAPDLPLHCRAMQALPPRWRC